MVRGIKDDPKSKQERRRIIENKITCDVPGCCEFISFYKGPNSDTKCREHQLQGVDYNGNAFSDRIYTYHKKHYCEDCGYNPYEDTLRFHLFKFENEEDMKRCQNKMLTVDHIDGDHENNDPENCKTLCHFCHSIKTHINKDWVKNKHKDY
jgi:hypothetical protein